MMGLVAIGHQLVALGVLRHPVIPIYSDVYNMLNEMYHDLGDTLSFQYAGSGTVNTMDKYRQIENWESHSRQILENMRRFYANSFVGESPRRRSRCAQLNVPMQMTTSRLPLTSSSASTIPPTAPPRLCHVATTATGSRLSF